MSYQYQATSEITVNGIPSCVTGFRDGYDSGSGGAKTMNSMVAHNMSNSLATLCNIGNSCYMNSVLYTLRFAPNFTHNLHHLIEYLELVVQKSIGDHPFSLLRLSHYTSTQHQLAQQHKPKSSSLGRNIPGLHGANCRSWSSKDLASLGSNGSNSGGSIATFSSVTGSGQSVFTGSVINNGMASEPGSNIVCSAGVATTATNSSIGSDSSNNVKQRENESVVHTGGVKNKRQMVCETLHELFHNLARNEATEITEPFHAGNLLQAVQCVSATFEGNQQQDAHEFLMCILDSVREACQTLNKNLVENPDLLSNSTTSQAVAPSAEAMDNPSVAATTSLLSSSSESKSGGTPFIARNIFRRRKESVKSAKVFSCSRDLAKSQTAVPAFVTAAAVDCTTNEQTPTVGRNQTDASADAGCGMGNQVEGGNQKTHLLDGRVEVQDRIRDLGLNFFCEDFEGVTVSRTRCLSCETITEQKETMIDIAIPIMASEVNDAAKNPQQFYQDACITQEYFRGDNKYRCEVCSGYTEACRTISFDVLPRLLVLQLKRFNGDMEKINSYIPTPFVLQCFCRDCLGKQNSERRHVYRLYSVITHVGARLSVGHYIAYTSALDFPLQYVNCARERQRRCVLSATFEGGLQGSASDGLGGYGAPVGKGHAAGGSEKSTSGQLKKLFGGKKASSASDMSKKLKNNVISRFSPNNGVEAVQLNGNAGPQSGNNGSIGLSGVGDYFNGGPFCVGERLDGSIVSGYGGENGAVKTREHMFSRLACQSGGCCGISLKAATRHQQVSASASVCAGGIGSGNGASSSTTSVTTRSANCRPASSVASAPNTAASHHTYSLYDSNCGSDSVDEGGTTTLVNCSSFLRSTTSDSSSSNSSATTTTGNTIKAGLSLNDGSFGLTDFSVQQPLLWYMCDDDKIKIMTQPEFEEMLSPNRRHVITPYLLFYARYDVQQKLLQPSPVKSSCKSSSTANAEGSSMLFVPDPAGSRHTPQ
ncbi:uncharacterized protein LOC128266948 [Anopheles cruzii]|uniref:uncharacterized protein LOC128266948 n=1 Tax=Anopheles cruzii TaxID=68878 RepID=UPI0022EC212D|nr:uncharacterized protein LOC128266948 [Anopheles cruzii]